MRRAAIAATFLAAVVLGADPGIELVYAFGPEESAVAAKVLRKRLELLAIEGAGVRVEDEERVAIRLEAPDRVAEVKEMATRVGRLETCRIVGPDAPGYAKRRTELSEALAKGVELEKVRDVPPESLSGEERAHWPHGLRWYRNTHPSETLQEDWILCAADDQPITEEALEGVSVSEVLELRREGGRKVCRARWRVNFKVKERFRSAMKSLVSKGQGDEVRVAVILDGDIVSAALLWHKCLSFPDEPSARELAAVHKGGVLPRKPTLVEERQE